MVPQDRRVFNGKVKQLILGQEDGHVPHAPREVYAKVDAVVTGGRKVTAMTVFRMGKPNSLFRTGGQPRTSGILG